MNYAIDAGDHRYTFFTRTITIWILLVLTAVSCRDSATTSFESDRQKDLEEVLADKLGSDMTLEEWGITMEEFEGAYHATHNPENKQASSRSVLLSSEDSPPVWESDYGTGLNLGDDECEKVEIGFPFTFYGETYTELWVNSNGNLTFDKCNTRFRPTDIPDFDNRVIIGPLYGDFIPSEQGSDVYVNTLGSDSNRIFVVTWQDVPEWVHSGDEPGANTFQVQLSEGSDRILFGYNGLTTNGINDISDTPMNVGISDGDQSYINSATGAEIPELDLTNICYTIEEGEYKEIFGACGTGPEADAGPDQQVECEGDSTAVALNGTGSSHSEDEPLIYSWALNDHEIATGESPSVNLPMGSHTISLTVEDSLGNADRDEVTVDIVDSTPPELVYTVETTELWPPNNELHLALSGIIPDDRCDTDPSLLIRVTDSSSDGRIDDPNDWDIVRNSDGTFDVYLRAKRSGGDSGRSYTVALTTEDASGNEAEETVEVTVPHSMSR